MAEQCRLAGAVPPHQGDALAGLDSEREVAEDRRAVAELVPDALEFERG
jgi:hypothetical protein